MKNKPSSTEQHPHFPSGEWEGFYIYGMGASQKYKMNMTLSFKKGIISGSGSDSIGSFSWNGSYDIKLTKCTMAKHYHGRHKVSYQGDADENGIWGTWTLGHMSGGFHIWPKQQEENQEEAEAEVKKKKTKKIGTISGKVIRKTRS